MEDLQRACANPYSLHHAMLQRQVLEAASASRDDLEDAGIELDEWLEIGGYRSDSRASLTNFDILKRLHATGELSVSHEDCAIPKMRRWDVFFALALRENDAAHYIFSAEALGAKWDPADVALFGLSAAVAAANAYMFGLLLKAQINQLH